MKPKRNIFMEFWEKVKHFVTNFDPFAAIDLRK